MDSMPQGSQEPKTFSAHFLIEAWAALQPQREALNLCPEAPTVEELMAKIQFVCPKVRLLSRFSMLGSM